MQKLPILDGPYARPRPVYRELEDFEALPKSIHERIRSYLRTETPCSSCVNPLCSCSGGSRSEIIFLPGEREWSEQYVTKYRGSDPNRFPLCGDCTQLDTFKCTAGFYKPFDCISFPLQPVVVNGNLVPMFSKSCRIHPADLNPGWVSERWEAWKYIFNIIPEWVELYGRIPSGHLLKP